jgi:hypothetical protein
MSLRLPGRLPAGTKLVVEGRGTADGRLRVSARYVELPNGRLINLPRSISAASRSAARGAARATGTYQKKH